MNKDTKALKSRYRNLCTKVVETRDKNDKVVARVRVRREGSPSLREWAEVAKGGREWLQRKRDGR
jgi:hypothetical protein